MADEGLGSRARLVVEHLAAHGASFFDDIASGTRLLRAELEDALAELVVRGRIHGDSYAGLRALLVPPGKRASASSSQRKRVALERDRGRGALVAGAGRDATVVEVETDGAKEPSPEAVEQVARILLRRYGVVCWRLLEREPGWLPSWRELSRAWRRLEARGEIRGGRFIAGVSGEQFALPEAIAAMRQVRRQPGDGAWVCLSAVDPAHLLGTVLPGPRLPRVAGARALYRDGVPVATSVAGQTEWLLPLEGEERASAARALVQGSTPDLVGRPSLEGLRPAATIPVR